MKKFAFFTFVAVIITVVVCGALLVSVLSPKEHVVPVSSGERWFESGIAVSESETEASFESGFSALEVGGNSGKIISWGLGGYGNERIPSAPPGSLDLLKKYDGLYVVEGEKEVVKKVYLTFDLGYEAGYTDEVLDVLKEHDIKAVFFLCGHYLKQDELVARMINEGHVIGNHTNMHKDLPMLSNDGIVDDIDSFTKMFDEKYGEAYGKKMTLFRPGRGRMCERTVRLASELGYRTVMWSSAIVDWGKEAIDAEKSASKVMERIHAGNVMLFHISNSGMPKMLELLVPRVLEAGYEFGDVWGI